MEICCGAAIFRKVVKTVCLFKRYSVHVDLCFAVANHLLGAGLHFMCSNCPSVGKVLQFLLVPAYQINVICKV